MIAFSARLIMLRADVIEGEGGGETVAGQGMPGKGSLLSAPNFFCDDSKGNKIVFFESCRAGHGEGESVVVHDARVHAWGIMFTLAERERQSEAAILTSALGDFTHGGALPRLFAGDA